MKIMTSMSHARSTIDAMRPLFEFIAFSSMVRLYPVQGAASVQIPCGRTTPVPSTVPAVSRRTLTALSGGGSDSVSLKYLLAATIYLYLIIIILLLDNFYDVRQGNALRKTRRENACSSDISL
ncbi:MAG: hypothetical protein QCH35_05815 [Methanomicrobiaceae archaeon]|nr:hypothetical protein [Methanomicrobiaceae archaeon]